MKSIALYAVKYHDGTIKVGCATSCKRRWKALKSTTGRGKRPEAYFCTPYMESAGFAAESHALTSMRKRFIQANTKEMFFCTDFLAVVNVLRNSYLKYSDPCATGWRLFIGVDPIPRLDSGGKQRKDKAGRWSCSQS